MKCSALFRLSYLAFVYPIGLCLFMVGALFSRKIRQGLAMRIWTTDFNIKGKPVLWIHAASGEFEYAKPVLSEWKRRHPDWHIHVTYFSPSFKAAVERFPETDSSSPLPLDLPGPIRHLLKRLKPSALLIARTDLWPELLFQCRAQGIPTILFSATKTKPVAQWQRPLWSWRHSLLNHIYCVSASDRLALVDSGVKVPVTAIGDTRFDQVAARLATPKLVKEELRPRHGLVMVAGSTWESDEAVLLPALKEFLAQDQLRLIIAPHEPTTHHIEKLIKHFNCMNLTVDRYSEATQWSSQILLVDTVGILAELYTWGNLAFVGGSFSRGVHSVMEPLAAGLPTFVGPRHLNNREALEFQNIPLFESLKMVTAVNNAKTLATGLEQAIKVAPRLPEIAALVRNEIKKRQGASRKVCEHLENFLGI